MNDTLTAPPPPHAPPASAPAPAPGPRPLPVFPAPTPHAVGFVLFVVLNFVLFVRPTEIFEDLLGLEIYMVTILLCLAVSFSAVAEQLLPRTLERRPLTLCVVGVTAGVVLSHLSALRLEPAWEWGVDFFKMLVYFLLFLGVVRDTSRLRTLLWWLTLFITFSTLLMVLEYHEVIKLPTVTKLKDGEFLRLRGSGIFADPNDLCVLLVAALMLSGCWLTDRRAGAAALLWLAPIGLLTYALLLTQSRGGLLALLAALAVLFRSRFGGWSAVLLAAVVLPAVLLLVGGRQAGISTSAETGQERIGYWSDALMSVRAAPLFGIGRSQFVQEAGQVAHNSYLQALAETGLFGGTFFVGGFLYALYALDGLKRGKRRILDPELARLHPFVMASLAGYMAGMMTLTLTYLLPTFTMLATAAVFLRLAPTDPPAEEPRFDVRFVGRLLGLTVLFLLFMTVFVRLTRGG